MSDFDLGIGGGVDDPLPEVDFPPTDDFGGDHELWADLNDEAPPINAIVALAGKPTAELPPTRNPAGSIKSAVADVIRVKTDAAWRRRGRNAPPPAPAVAAAAPQQQERARASIQLPERPRWAAKRHRQSAWTEDDTARFYNGLRQFGTNIGLLAMLFPSRERDEVARKFRHEQKNNAAAVASALDPRSDLPVDVSSFTEQAHEWARQHMIRSAAPLNDDEQSIMREIGENEAAVAGPDAGSTSPPQAGLAAPAGAQRPAGAPVGNAADRAHPPQRAAGNFPATGDDDDDAPLVDALGLRGGDDDAMFRLFSDGTNPASSAAGDVTAANAADDDDDDRTFADRLFSGSPTTAGKPAPAPKSKRHRKEGASSMGSRAYTSPTTAGSAAPKPKAKGATKPKKAGATAGPPAAAEPTAEAVLAATDAVDDDFTLGGFDLFEGDDVAADDE